MYKLNLQNLNESSGLDRKLLKKYVTSMQKLRSLKFKKYAFWRFDKRDLQIIEGGWHFSFMQTPVKY